MAQELIARLRSNIARVFLGNPEAIDRVVCSLLARGHILIEDVPGVGKTVLASALARSLDCAFTRVQLTPDLLPADIVGVSVYSRETGEFVFKRGPVFTNILLADELNRTTPRTQAALLEAMSESTVTVDGKTHALEAPFMVIATQNPFDFEGTYQLPENQLDRFLMRTTLGYPDPEVEASVLDLRPANSALPTLVPVMTRAEVIALQGETDRVRVDRSLNQYIVALANATRRHDEVRVGLSPRGALALAQAARASAVMDGRDYCIPEDVLRNFEPVAAHRIVTKTFASNGDVQGVDRLLREAVRAVPSP